MNRRIARHAGTPIKKRIKPLNDPRRLNNKNKLKDSFYAKLGKCLDDMSRKEDISDLYTNEESILNFEEDGGESGWTSASDSDDSSEMVDDVFESQGEIVLPDDNDSSQSSTEEERCTDDKEHFSVSSPEKMRRTELEKNENWSMGPMSLSDHLDIEDRISSPEKMRCSGLGQTPRLAGNRHLKTRLIKQFPGEQGISISHLRPDEFHDSDKAESPAVSRQLEKSKNMAGEELPVEENYIIAQEPRVKRVCRRASVVLGLPRATFSDVNAPKESFTLGALPQEENQQILETGRAEEKGKDVVEKEKSLVRADSYEVSSYDTFLNKFNKKGKRTERKTISKKKKAKKEKKNQETTKRRMEQFTEEQHISMSPLRPVEFHDSDKAESPVASRQLEKSKNKKSPDRESYENFLYDLNGKRKKISKKQKEKGEEEQEKIRKYKEYLKTIPICTLSLKKYRDGKV